MLSLLAALVLLELAAVPQAAVIWAFLWWAEVMQSLNLAALALIRRCAGLVQRCGMRWAGSAAQVLTSGRGGVQKSTRNIRSSQA